MTWPGLSPGSIELVEAHGTGTKVGDAIELEALEQVFQEARPEASWCALGSIKSQVGHTKAAAGAAGLIKAALALHHKVLPPTIKVREPIEPLTTGTSPFYLSTEARPWLSSPGHPRRAAVSAFGFGGSNFHCVLEEAGPEKAGIDWGGDVQILAYSGTGAAELEAALPRWTDATAWADVREEAARSRAEFQAGHHARLVMVTQRGAPDPARLIAEARARLATSSPECALASKAPGRRLTAYRSVACDLNRVRTIAWPSGHALPGTGLAVSGNAARPGLPLSHDAGDDRVLERHRRAWR